MFYWNRDSIRQFVELKREGELLLSFSCFYLLLIDIMNYINKETSHSISDGGIGLTSEQMKTQDNYKDWDFINIWEINNDYPTII